MKAEDKLDYAIMSLEQRPVATDAAIGAIRAALGDIATLRAEMVILRGSVEQLQKELSTSKRAAFLVAGSLALARDELARVGLMGTQPVADWVKAAAADL